MKLGLLIALTPDRRSVGRVLSPLLPLSEVVGAVKKAIAANKAPDARFPVLQAVSIGSVVREHRFRPTAEEIAAYTDGSIRDATVEDLHAALELAEARAGESLKLIEELNEALEVATAATVGKASLVTILEGQLAEANKRIAELSVPPAPIPNSTTTQGGESAASPAASSDAPAGGDQLGLIATASDPTAAAAGKKPKK